MNLAYNELSGELDPSIAQLNELTILDISNNTFTLVPDELSALKQLRTLNMSHNNLTQLSFETIKDLHLIELNASYNKLVGPLITGEGDLLNSLQTLSLASNRLNSLTDSVYCLAALREVNLSNNRLASMPDVSNWDELLTMDLCDNQLSGLPAGFTSLKKIKQVSFRGNNLRTLDLRIGLMESLGNLQLSGNPLRSRRVLNLATEDLKTELRSQLEPDLENDAQDDAVAPPKEDTYRSFEPAETTKEETWPVRPGGILDRSSTGLETLDMSILQATAAQQDIRRLELHHNLLSSIPQSLSILAATLIELNLSHNKLDSDLYLPGSLDLPHLQKLNLSCNAISTLEPLVTQLFAPRLSALDISANRLTTLISLRLHFPSLTTLVANDNTISELDVECVSGLAAIDLRNNDVGSLPPKLGLLSEVKSLDVTGNRFKIPSYAVLQKGTDALMAWLRDKIPLEDWNAGVAATAGPTAAGPAASHKDANPDVDDDEMF